MSCSLTYIESVREIMAERFGDPILPESFEVDCAECRWFEYGPDRAATILGKRYRFVDVRFHSA